MDERERFPYQIEGAANEDDAIGTGPFSGSVDRYPGRLRCFGCLTECFSQLGG